MLVDTKRSFLDESPSEPRGSSSELLNRSLEIVVVGCIAQFAEFGKKLPRALGLLLSCRARTPNVFRDAPARSNESPE